jgi:hypothetical protein
MGTSSWEKMTFPSVLTLSGREGKSEEEKVSVL